MINENGVFKSQTTAEWQELYYQTFEQAFGPSFIRDPTTPEGQIIGTSGSLLAQSDSANLAIINQYNPLTASGIYLRRLGSIFGILPDNGSKSSADIDLIGDPNVFIPAGSIVADDEDNNFDTVADVTLDGLGDGSVGVLSQELAAIPVPIGSITNIVSVVPGWTSIVQTTAGVEGSYAETDAQYRARYFQTKNIAGQGTADNVQSILLGTPGVNSSLVLNNTESTPTVIDGVTVAAHSIRSIVGGGTDQDVADGIYIGVSAGCGTDGTNTVQVTSNLSGQVYDIKFDRPTEKIVDILLDITQFDNFEADGLNKITVNLVEFINALPIGQDVVYSRLFQPINEVVGFQVNSLQIAFDGDTLGTQTLLVNGNQKAITSSLNITFIIT